MEGLKITILITDNKLVKLLLWMISLNQLYVKLILWYVKTKQQNNKRGNLQICYHLTWTHISLCEIGDQETCIIK